MKRTSKISMFTLLLVGCLVFVGLAFRPSASALSGSDFNVGRIMDDAVFFNPNTMNPGDIQNFLNSKVPVCDTNGTQAYAGTTRANYGTSRGYPPPFICVKDFSQTLPDVAADNYCHNGISGGSKSAAQIIYDVAQACGVSPKVLIVLLQKEQNLITDDWPWSIQYRSATGYGCPDTAPCDAQYYGFFNQLYNAAHQFQRYVKQANQFNFVGGQTSFIQYNPNSGCGGSNVAIQNQTTAGLYNYTPYQPNQAALNNLGGSGDSCSAYGNRNFWYYYINWFGSTFTNTPYAWMYEGQWAYSDAARTQLFSSIPTVAPGGKFYVTIKSRNMGTQTWSQSTFHLGASRPLDRTSQFYDSSTWISASRPGRLVESSVPPGQIGTFQFTMQAPNTAGTYNEYFNPLVEGVTWLNDLGLLYTINVNTAAGVSNSTNTSLASGGVLNKDDYLLSPDSQTTLSLQKDGNLVLFSNMQTAWSTGPSKANKLIMQTDGNLVLYDNNMVPVWASGTQNNFGARLVLQTDGNLVIYSSSNVPLWATYTIQNPDHLSYVNTNFAAGRMYPGQSLDTADRKYHLIFQGDGNLVLYSPTKALWATGTDGKQVAFLALQLDGNLVLYDKSSRPIWNSNTAGTGKLRIVVQQDGNLVLYNTLGRPFWNTETSGQ